MTVISGRRARASINLFGVEDGDPAPRAPVTTSARSIAKQIPIKSCVTSDTIMAQLRLRWWTILGTFEQVQTEKIVEGGDSLPTERLGRSRSWPRRMAWPANFDQRPTRPIGNLHIKFTRCD